MASTKKTGYVITRAASLKEYFTSSTSYDRPQWVPLSEASVYVSPELAQQAAKKLWMKGSFAAKVQSIQELLDIEMDMAPKEEPLPGEEGKEQDSEMIAAKQGDPALDGEVEGVCPECSCEPCECDDAALADGQPTDEIPTDEPPLSDQLPSREPAPEDELRLGAEHEEDSLLGQHLKRAAGMEGEENARLHPEELRMLGKKRMDMKEDEFKMPTRPGNDPEPSENKDTVPNLKAPYDSKQVDFKDPVGTEDKPQTDLCYAVAHEHDEKVPVPAELMSQLKAVVAEFTKAAEDSDHVDDIKGSFALTAASALQQLVDDLELGTVAGIKQAQLHMTSYMNPITSHVPEEVLKFIAYGGRKPSLKDLFNVKWESVRGVE